MTRDDITARARLIISLVTDTPLDEIRPDTDLRHDLGADDLDRLQILFDIEEALDLEIGDDDAERIHTVSDLVAHLAARLGLLEAVA